MADLKWCWNVFWMGFRRGYVYAWIASLPAQAWVVWTVWEAWSHG